MTPVIRTIRRRPAADPLGAGQQFRRRSVAATAAVAHHPGEDGAERQVALALRQWQAAPFMAATVPCLRRRGGGS